MDYDRVNKYEQNILSKQVEKYHGENTRDSDSDDVDVDELLNELEDEAEDNDVFVRYREQRLQEISQHIKKVEDSVKFGNYGILDTVNEESKLLKMSSEIDRIIIHFQMETFAKCRFMNDRLKTLSQKHLTTKFVKVNVEDCPFLVKKLNIKVLPFVVGYRKGKEVLRLVGFSKLGNDPNGFSLENLETQLKVADLLDSTFSIGISKSQNDDDSDSGLDI
ncbi:phosducin-like protein 1 [Monosporozyma unispora]|nr:hypothetical protein C6P44_004902 [Kazachstania unispora]